MKKWLGGIIVILLLIGLLLPGMMGSIAQKRLQEFVTQMPANSNVSVKVLSYNKGWFSSTMQLDVAFNNPQHNPPVHVQVNEVVKHGPFIINFKPFYLSIAQAYAVGEVVVPEDQQALFKQYVDQTTLFNNALVLHLFGGVSVCLDTPELTVSSPVDKNAKVTLENISTKATVSDRMNKVSTRTNIQSVVWQAQQTVITINNMSGGSKLEKSPQGLWLGMMKGELESLNVDANSKPVLTLKNLQYNSDSREDKGLIHSLNNFAIDSAIVKGTTYGPGQLTLSFKNINATALGKLKALNRAMSINPAVASMNVADVHAQKLLLKTIGRGLQFSVDPISLQTPNGQIAGQIDVSLPNLMDDKDGNPLKHPRINIAALLSNMDGSVQITIPKVIVMNNLSQTIAANLQAMTQGLSNGQINDQQLTAAANQRATAQLQRWVSNGILVDNGDNYQFAASFQQGQLSLNGKPLFSGALGGGMPVNINVNAPGMAPMPNPANQQMMPLPPAPADNHAPGPAAPNNAVVAPAPPAPVMNDTSAPANAAPAPVAAQQ